MLLAERTRRNPRRCSLVGFEATIIRKEPKALLLVQKSYKAFIPIMTITIKALKITKTLHTDDTLRKSEMHQCAVF